MLRFVKPKLSGPDLMPLVWPEFHNLDDSNDIVLLTGVDRATTLVYVRLINTQTWTVSEPPEGVSGGNTDFSHTWKGVFYLDKLAKILYCAAMRTPPSGPAHITVRALDCVNWKWSAEPLLNLQYDPEMLEASVSNDAPPVMRFWREYLWLWHPLGAKAFRIRFSQVPVGAHPHTWEEVVIEGAVSRTTHYTVNEGGPGSSLLFAFAGWDDNAQSNNFNIIELEERPTGDKTDDLKPVTMPVLKWSRPHVDGTIARPRNDTGLCSVDDTTLVAFGGWNGRNYIGDFEIIKLMSEISRDPLGKLLDSADELTDVKIELKDDKFVDASKIVLYSRSSFFRKYLDMHPNDKIIKSTELSAIPFAKPVLSFF